MLGANPNPHKNKKNKFKKKSLTITKQFGIIKSWKADNPINNFWHDKTSFQ